MTTLALKAEFVEIWLSL